eukprot:SAG31_NODE_4318_length_3362_cov_17.927061_3_plen_102_part_00
MSAEDIVWEHANGYSTLKEATISTTDKEYIIQFYDDHNEPYKYDLKYYIKTPTGRIPLERDNILIHKDYKNEVAVVPVDYKLKDDEHWIDFTFFDWNAEDW